MAGLWDEIWTWYLPNANHSTTNIVVFFSIIFETREPILFKFRQYAEPRLYKVINFSLYEVLQLTTPNFLEWIVLEISWKGNYYIGPKLWWLYIGLHRVKIEKIVINSTMKTEGIYSSETLLTTMKTYGGVEVYLYHSWSRQEMEMSC
jgi:hypothetical protein